MFLTTFLKLLFLESFMKLGGLWRTLPPLLGLFYGVHSFFYYQHGQYVEGVSIIESFLGMKQGDPLRGFLFALAHY
jgi:hypothetical protein